MQCLKYIIANEGPRALFKGIGPNVLGKEFEIAFLKFIVKLTCRSNELF